MKSKLTLQIMPPELFYSNETAMAYYTPVSIFPKHSHRLRNAIIPQNKNSSLSSELYRNGDITSMDHHTKLPYGPTTTILYIGQTQTNSPGERSDGQHSLVHTKSRSSISLEQRTEPPTLYHDAQIIRTHLKTPKFRLLSRLNYSILKCSNTFQSLFIQQHPVRRTMLRERLK